MNLLQLLLLLKIASSGRDVSRQNDFPPEKEVGMGISFRATDVTPRIMNGDSSSREVLRFQSSEVTSSCETSVRIPCNRRGMAVTRTQCDRWRCCWDGNHPVQCAEGRFQVFYPPSPTPPTNITTTTEHPTDTTVMRTTAPDGTTAETTKQQQTTQKTTTDDPGQYSECGIVPTKTAAAVSARSFELKMPVARLLMSIITGRILGGTETEQGDWPWMVYLYEKPVGRAKGFICGGALLNREWIVTAAHCLVQPNSPEIYGVVLGEHSISTKTAQEKDFDIERIIRHDKFDRNGNFANDIALMKLSKPVQFSRYIAPICLLEAGFPTDSTTSVSFKGNVFTYAGRVCTALGWGKTAFKERVDIMQQVNVIIMPHLLCSSATNNPSAEPYGFRPVQPKEAKFCAGGTVGQDTCDGDSGGPLLCVNDDGKYYLHGITSYGTKPCGQKNLPGVYTRATDYYPWIMENIK